MIKNKLLHFKTLQSDANQSNEKKSFIEALESGDVSNEHIAFIQDVPAIWTHGTFYYAGKEPIENINMRLAAIETKINNQLTWQ